MYPGKRFFDISFSIILLILFIPAFALIAIIVKIDNKGPVFYKAPRIGQFGKEFKMWKFRTMVKGAALNGPNITVSNDCRVTKSGKFLRGTKIDELPSFWNVLRGEMSIVGPRPECAEWVKKYSNAEKRVLLFKPGITGPAQIQFKNEEKMLSGETWHSEYLKIMKRKLSIDLQYFSANSFLQDLTNIYKTVLRCWIHIRE